MMSNDLSSAKKVSEVRRTSEGDLSGISADKANLLNAVATRLEVNGVRKDIVSQENRRRLSLVDEKDLISIGNNCKKDDVCIYLETLVFFYS